MISPYQSVFIHNHLIIVNVIISYECLHKIICKKKGRFRTVAHTLNISKAYDKVEWCFLKYVLLKLGFPTKSIKLIMSYVTTPNFSVRINGEARGLIYPQNGLQQGCPLFPYLFIICVEYLSTLLRRAEKAKIFYSIHFNKLIMSHLLFADDSLIFVSATVQDCLNLKSISSCYTTTLGKLFNYKISLMLLSLNIHQQTKEKNL